MDADVGGSNNGDGVDDGIVVNISCGYDDGECIFDFGDEKDADGNGHIIDNGIVATNDGIDPDFGVDKTI